MAQEPGRIKDLETSFGELIEIMKAGGRAIEWAGNGQVKRLEARYQERKGQDQPANHFRLLEVAMNLPAIRSSKELAIVTSKQLPKYLTYDEVQRVLERIENPRDHFLCNFLWQTGCRITEVLAVNGTDVDHRAEVLQVYTLKRKKKPIRMIPVKSALLKDLAFYLLKTRKTPQDNLFDFTRQRAYQIVHNSIMSAGIEREKAKPHTFRHSFAIHCLLNQVPVTVLQKWLGHANIQNTLVYLQILGLDTRAFMNQVQF